MDKTPRRIRKKRVIMGGPIAPRPTSFMAAGSSLTKEVLTSLPSPDVARLGGELLSGMVAKPITDMSGPTRKIARVASHPKDTSAKPTSIPSYTPPAPYSHPSAKMAYPRQTPTPKKTTRGISKGGARPI